MSVEGDAEEGWGGVDREEEEEEAYDELVALLSADIAI